MFGKPLKAITGNGVGAIPKTLNLTTCIVIVVEPVYRSHPNLQKLAPGNPLNRRLFHSYYTIRYVLACKPAVLRVDLSGQGMYHAVSKYPKAEKPLSFLARHLS